jgi:hypothetical protein
MFSVSGLPELIHELGGGDVTAIHLEAPEKD